MTYQDYMNLSEEGKMMAAIEQVAAIWMASGFEPLSDADFEVLNDVDDRAFAEPKPRFKDDD